MSRGRDYAPRKNSGNQSAKSRSGRGGSRTSQFQLWMMMIFGLLMGLLVAVFVYMARPHPAMPHAPDISAAELEQKPHSTRKKPKAPTELPPATQSPFDFYRILGNKNNNMPMPGNVKSVEIVPPAPRANSKPLTPSLADIAAVTPSATVSAPVVPVASVAPVPSPKPAKSPEEDPIAQFAHASTPDPVPAKAPTPAPVAQIAAAKPVAKLPAKPVVKAPVAAVAEEVPMPKPVSPAVKPAEPKAAAVATGKSKRFLQVAARQTRPEAESERARVALTGLPSRIDEATLANGSVWYRVRVGPFGDAEAVKTAQQKLANEGFAGTFVVAP